MAESTARLRRERGAHDDWGREEPTGLSTAEKLTLAWLLLLLLLAAAYLAIQLVPGISKLTPTEWAAWVQAVGSIAAIVAAVWIPYAQRKTDREALRVGQLETIAVDVAMARRQADVYLRSPYKAPAYRLELLGRDLALLSLLASGELSATEASHLVQFYVDARSFNFCLDRMQTLVDDRDATASELRRTRAKAEHLIPGTKLSRYDPAMVVLKRHLPPESLARLAMEQPSVTTEED